MKEILTDYWSLLLPEEWFAEQDGETIVVADNDEVSVIEITSFLPEKGLSLDALCQEFKSPEAKSSELAGLPVFFQEFEEDEMFWREWICPAEKAVVVISHGCDIENRHMDDSAVDEILSTLLFGEAD